MIRDGRFTYDGFEGALQDLLRRLKIEMDKSSDSKCWMPAEPWIKHEAGGCWRVYLPPLDEDEFGDALCPGSFRIQSVEHHWWAPGVFATQVWTHDIDVAEKHIRNAWRLAVPKDAPQKTVSASKKARRHLSVIVTQADRDKPTTEGRT